MRTNISPATTGETEKGRSMSAVSSVRPGNRNRAMAQAAATPKTRLARRASGTTVRVKRIEWRVSGSSTRFFQYAARPSPSAPAKTCTTGITISTPTAATAARVRAQRTQAGSSWAWRLGISLSGARVWTAVSGMGLVPLAPALQQVDEHEHREGDDEEHDRDGGGLAVGELLEAGHDQDGRDLRLVGHVPGHEHDGAVLSERPREGEREPGDQGRAQGGQD